MLERCRYDKAPWKVPPPRGLKAPSKSWTGQSGANLGLDSGNCLKKSVGPEVETSAVGTGVKPGVAGFKPNESTPAPGLAVAVDRPTERSKSSLICLAKSLNIGHGHWGLEAAT